MMRLSGDRTDRDRDAVLGTITVAIRNNNGDPDGQARTELLMALGLHDLALTMQAEAGLPAVLNAGVPIGPVLRAVRHGTPAGLDSHLRRGQEPCKPCRDMNPSWQNRSRALAALTPDDPSLGGQE